MMKAITMSKQDPATRVSYLTLKTMDDLEHMLLDPSAHPTYMQLSLLEDITDNFSDARCIGRGGFAFVYKGKLRNGMVAVKKLYKMVEEIHEAKFEQEARNLMRVKHKNIVRFLGYCSDTQRKMVNCNGMNVMAEERQRLLCFEFLPKGSLDKYITDASCGLEWHERYDIIKGICFGLQYLHMECNIAHMDLKPHNIVMDANMVAKIGDFGTSRLVDPNKSMVTSNIMGTLGYMAPEYIKNGLVSKKADIFSFGVIILELLTGSRHDDQILKLLTGSRHDDLSEESSMARYSVEVVEKWMKRLPNAAYSQQVSTCLLIALECVSGDKDKRPCTDCIIDKLIKVESEIREKLINEGQEWVEGITNVTAGVVALVLILQSRLLTTGAAVIVLLCLQNPMSSWPRAVFGIGAVLLTVLMMNPRTWPWMLLILKVPTALLLKILVEVAIFVRRALTIPVVSARRPNLMERTLGEWERTLGELVPAMLVARAFIAKRVTATTASVLGIILLDRRRWSWMTLLLFTIVSILAAVLVLLNRSNTSWSWVVVARTIMKAIITPVNCAAISLATLFDTVTVNIRGEGSLRKLTVWAIILIFAMHSAVDQVVQAVVTNTVYQDVPATALSIMALRGDDSGWKLWAWIILFFAIEAVRATVTNLVNPIILSPPVATAYSVVRFLVALLCIQVTDGGHLFILDIKSLGKQAILFVEGGLLLILLNGPITFWSSLMVEVMIPFTILGLTAVTLLPVIIGSTSISEWELLLLHPVVVALAADSITIVIIRGIMGIFAL